MDLTTFNLRPPFGGFFYAYDKQSSQCFIFASIAKVIKIKLKQKYDSHGVQDEIH